MARDEEEMLDENQDEELDIEQPEDEEGTTASSRRRGRAGGRSSRAAGRSQERSPGGPCKSQATAMLLSAFLGWLGVDRFYLGHMGMGATKLAGTIITLALLLVNTGSISPSFTPSIAYGLAMLCAVGMVLTLHLHDLVLIGMGRMRDADGAPLKRDNNGENSPRNLYQGRAFLLALFGGIIGQDRFYLKSPSMGYVKTGLFVLGTILLLVASPRWRGLHSYPLAVYTEATPVYYKEIRRLQPGEGDNQGGAPTHLTWKGGLPQPIEAEPKGELGEPRPEKLLVTHKDFRFKIKVYPTPEEVRELAEKEHAFKVQTAAELPIPLYRVAKEMGYVQEVKDLEFEHPPAGAGEGAQQNADAGDGGDGEAAAGDDDQETQSDNAGEDAGNDDQDGNSVEGGDAPIAPGEPTLVTIPLKGYDLEHEKLLAVERVKQRMLKGLLGDFGQKPPIPALFAYVNQFPLASARESDTLLYVALGLLGLAILLWKLDVLLLGMGKLKDGQGRGLGLDPLYTEVFCSECGEVMTIDLNQAEFKHVVCSYHECQGYCQAPKPETIGQLRQNRDRVLDHTVYAVCFFLATVLMLCGAFYTMWPDAWGQIPNMDLLPGLDTARNILWSGVLVMIGLTIWQIVSAEQAKPVLEF